MKSMYYGPLILLIMMVAGCSSGDQITKLHDFVDEPQPRPQIPALPPLPHYSPTPYVNPLDRDPFTSFSELALREEAANANHGTRPKQKGPLQPLEKYSLGSLTLIGMVQANGKYWGIFQIPDGKVYRARVGDSIGNENGKIIGINPQKRIITVEQYLPNAFGGYQKQKTTLRFPNP